ncbi:hypothetical protein D3Y57_01640 (plasmid) [Sphingomonas paeninsulae]|jgi:hypothetical protein|uniref:Uncharacterized protein n=1 Tax=Sphingomonas paeninsulae TaxID=2319844 RepID=A0A494TC41_SPHPE|nr:hypothetical protein [Sphingomonas paeninsulae]AYJ84814.1 hypothetical protein D3Y57_01640 [Sphingomonas paeninsulae]
MRNILIASALIALTATSSIAAPRGTIPAATPTGDPVNCVSISRIRETHVHGDSTIDFIMNGGKVYRNTLPNSCPSLGFEERFLYKTSTSELCSVDIITVLQSPGVSRGASCGLGQFQPVALVKTSK